MRHDVIGRGLRALRHRLAWRQRDLADRSGVSRSVIADLEWGRLEAHTVGALVATARALGATVRIDLVLPGGDIHRLLDADHAALQADWAADLEQAGWAVAAEVTFNSYGDRGSIDLLAFHAESGTLLIVEIKTLIVDVQALLAGIDRKTRVARALAAERGWTVRSVVPVLVVAEGSTARRRISDHAPLFGRFGLRGRTAMMWLRSPGSSGPAPTGILCFSAAAKSRSEGPRPLGRQRIRRVPRA